MAEKQNMKDYSVEELKALHEPDKSRFVVKLGEANAVLDYVERTPGVLDMYHTEVPGTMQGRGIGKILAKEAFNHVVKNDLKMQLSCSYLQQYLKDNPEDDYKKRVV